MEIGLPWRNEGQDTFGTSFRFIGTWRFTLVYSLWDGAGR